MPIKWFNGYYACFYLHCVPQTKTLHCSICICVLVCPSMIFHYMTLSYVSYILGWSIPYHGTQINMNAYTLCSGNVVLPWFLGYGRYCVLFFSLVFSVFSYIPFFFACVCSYCIYSIWDIVSCCNLYGRYDHFHIVYRPSKHFCIYL